MPISLPHHHPHLRFWFLVFSGLVIVGVIATLVMFIYRGRIGRLVESYREEIAVCANIVDEQTCFDNDRCQGIYTPSCPTCAPTFTECQEVSEQAATVYAEDKILCERTGGEWQKTKLGQLCTCDMVGMVRVFDKTQGCVTK
jgi:hypothetical protein